MVCHGNEDQSVGRSEIAIATRFFTISMSSKRCVLERSSRSDRFFWSIHSGLATEDLGRVFEFGMSQNKPHLVDGRRFDQMLVEASSFAFQTILILSIAGQGDHQDVIEP